MPSPALTTFHRTLQRIDATRNRMENLYFHQKILKTDIEYVYEALFLRAVTSFESYLEQQFVDIMLGKTRYSDNKIASLIRTGSKKALMAVLLQGNQYLDWLPYRKTEDRAKIYLKDGRPFTDFTGGDRSQIRNITYIRNSIAHKSDHAISTFREKVVGSIPLLVGEKRPAGFLRSQFRSSPRQIRFEIYLSELGRIAAALS